MFSMLYEFNYYLRRCRKYQNVGQKEKNSRNIVSFLTRFFFSSNKNFQTFHWITQNYKKIIRGKKLSACILCGFTANDKGFRTNWKKINCIFILIVQLFTGPFQKLHSTKDWRVKEEISRWFFFISTHVVTLVFIKTNLVINKFKIGALNTGPMRTVHL